MENTNDLFKIQIIKEYLRLREDEWLLAQNIWMTLFKEEIKNGKSKHDKGNLYILKL